MGAANGPFSWPGAAGGLCHAEASFSTCLCWSISGWGWKGVSRNKSKPDSVCCLSPCQIPHHPVFFFYFQCLVSVIKNKSSPTPFCSLPFQSLPPVSPLLLPKEKPGVLPETSLRLQYCRASPHVHLRKRVSFCQSCVMLFYWVLIRFAYVRFLSTPNSFCSKNSFPSSLW